MKKPARQGEYSKKIQPSTDGRLIYAVGDVHGRLDLLNTLLSMIAKDAALAASGARPVLIFLGDYIDRGPDSRGVIDRILRLIRSAAFDVFPLKGNHEDVLLSFIEDANFGPLWCRHGGRETLASYGVKSPLKRSEHDAWSRAQQAFSEALPASHLQFLAQLELTAEFGSYAFVHAGLRPGVPLASQRELDLLWIRNEFLSFCGPFEKIVVHGHTAEPSGHLGAHRIGVDTGAYATGVLTAVRLEGASRRLIHAKVTELPVTMKATFYEDNGFRAKADRFKRAWAA